MTYKVSVLCLYVVDFNNLYVSEPQWKLKWFSQISICEESITTVVKFASVMILSLKIILINLND